jgi:hypothetical protein
MAALVVADKGAEWRRLKSLVLDGVLSPITRQVYNLGLDEFFAWYIVGPHAGFTKDDFERLEVCMLSTRARIGPN